MASDIIESCIVALKQMKKTENIDYSKIYSLITNLQKTGGIDEVTSLLFELLLQENFKSNAMIRGLSKVNSHSCVNCRNNEFTQYTINVHPTQNISGMGMKSNQNAGDLIMDVCNKCSFCKLMKAPYWS